MTTAQVVAGVLALAGVVASLRWWRQPALRQPRWRLPLLLVLQASSAVLLYLALFPPLRPGANVPHVVLGPGARTGDALAASARGLPLLRLPEAPDVAGAEPVPDLATAMRRYPAITELQLLGDGLPARDRGVAAPLRFQPPTLAGLVELQPPALLAPGASFSVSGRVNGITDAQLELLDPAGRRVDQQPAAADGRFRLHASVRGAGDETFAVRVLNAQGKPVDTAPVPVQVREPAPLRLWLMAAAPNADAKYLQRWAADAGLQVHAQFGAGAGVVLGAGAQAFNAQTLARTDLLLIDARSLSALGAGQRATLRQAIDNGLGVLVRLEEAPDAGTRQALRQLGLALDGNGKLQPARIEAGTADAQRRALLQGPRANALGVNEAAPQLERLALSATDSAAVLARDADGNALGYWQASGAGRIGVWLLVDSYRLVLAGRDELHAVLWSDAGAAVARAADEKDSAVGTDVAAPRAWRGERTSVCAVNDGDSIRAPDGSHSSWRVDPDVPGCAAYWPALAGWHQRGDGEAFYVHDPADAPTLYRADTAAATLRELPPLPASTTATARGQPGPRWPWLLAWLACAGLLWWLERRRPRTGAPA